MTIADAAIKYAKERNQKKLHRLMDAIVSMGKNPMDVVIICDINRVGLETHTWVWDTFEEWQNI